MLTPISIVAEDLNDAFFLAVKSVMTVGFDYTIDKGSYEGQQRRELDFIHINIKKPGNRPIVPIMPQGLPAVANAEEIETSYMQYLMEGKKADKEIYTYGEDLEIQIPEVIRRYKEDGPNCNQLCMSVGDRNSMFMEHSQCLRMVDTRIRYDALHFMVYFRSWDLIGGFPTNLGGLQILKEYMASEIGVKDGCMIAGSKGLHIYDHHWDLANTYLGR